MTLAAVPPADRTASLRLLAFSWLAMAAWQFIVLAPLVLTLLIGLLVYGAPGAWPAALLFVGFVWWLMQGGQAPQGLEVAVDEVPGLRRELDALCGALQVPPFKTVVLVSEPTAAAVEHQDPWWPWRHHRTLVIGMPLLTGLEVAEWRAVLAHEMAHFSRHFGPGGHRLYRARQGWAELLETHRQDAVWFQAAAAFARWVVPRLERLASQQDRRDELEADALAARHLSADALGRALLRLAVTHDMPRLQALAAFGQGAEPADPARWSGQPLAPALPPAPHPERARRLAAGDLDPDAQALASHPSLRQRLAAFGVAADHLAVPAVTWEDTAAHRVWGEHWPACRDALASAWATEQAMAWRAERCWREACAARLPPRAAAPTLTAGAHLSAEEAARWAERFQCELATDTEPSWPAGADLTTEVPAWPPLTLFWWGAAALATRPELARPWLEAAIQADPVLAAPARVGMVAQGAGSAQEALRQAQLLALARQRRSEVREMTDGAGPRGLLPVGLHDWRAQALRAGLAAEPAVRRASWVRRVHEAGNGRRFPVVTLSLQLTSPADAAAPGVDEAQVQAVMQDLLARVIGPAEVAWVQTHWDSVAWPEWLAETEARHPDDVLKTPA